MAQPPTNPAVPYARTASDDTNITAIPPPVVPKEQSAATTDRNPLPSTTPAPLVGIGGVDDPNRKRNTSFKITGILPSRPPSNSDEDDVDDSTVTEDEVPDCAPIDKGPVGNGVTESGSAAPLASGPKAGSPQNTHSEHKQPPPSETSKVPSSAAPVVTTAALPANVAQRRNSNVQTTGGSKGSGVSGSGMLPSIRTVMAMGYRFNIFVYDHKSGNANRRQAFHCSMGGGVMLRIAEYKNRSRFHSAIPILS